MHKQSCQWQKLKFALHRNTRFPRVSLKKYVNTVSTSVDLCYLLIENTYIPDSCNIVNSVKHQTSHHENKFQLLQN